MKKIALITIAAILLALSGLGLSPAPFNGEYANAATGHLTPAYNRSDWPHWISDCQNTRAEILLRDNVGTIKFKRNKPCNVSWGRWICPYSGKEFTKASDMDIDHLVPLANANEMGGAQWTRERKREFANDPLNLIAVEKKVNRKKGDRGPEKWRPPDHAFWPEYAKRWRAVKKKYGLTISAKEETALWEMGR